MNKKKHMRKICSISLRRITIFYFINFWIFRITSKIFIDILFLYKKMDETNLIGSLRSHNGDFLRNAIDPFLYLKKSLYTANSNSFVLYTTSLMMFLFFILMLYYIDFTYNIQSLKHLISFLKVDFCYLK